MNIETLRGWSVALVWFAIAFPVLGAISAGARYFVDQRIQEMTRTQSRQEYGALQEALEAERNRASHEAASLRESLDGARAKVQTLEARTQPRDLTVTQRDAISSYLLKHAPQEIGLTILATDPEAEQFATKLRAAFEAGRWKVTVSRGFFQPAFRGVMVEMPAEQVPVGHPAALLVLALRSAGIEPLFSKREAPNAPVGVKVSSK